MSKAENEKNRMQNVSDEELDQVAGGAFTSRTSTGSGSPSEMLFCICGWRGKRSQLKRGGLCPNCSVHLGER